MPGPRQQPWVSAGGPAAKPQWQCQGQAWSSDFSWEQFSHVEKPTALRVSQTLLVIHPFQVCSDLTCRKKCHTSCPESSCCVGAVGMDLSVWPGWGEPSVPAPEDTVPHGSSKPLTALATAWVAPRGAGCGHPTLRGRLSLPALVRGNTQGRAGTGVPSSGHPGWAAQPLARARGRQCACVLAKDGRSFPGLPALGYISFACLWFQYLNS